VEDTTVGRIPSVENSQLSRRSREKCESCDRKKDAAARRRLFFAHSSRQAPPVGREKEFRVSLQRARRVLAKQVFAPAALP
jgi:hypothetical protein